MFDVYVVREVDGEIVVSPLCTVADLAAADSAAGAIACEMDAMFGTSHVVYPPIMGVNHPETYVRYTMRAVRDANGFPFATIKIRPHIDW